MKLNFLFFLAINFGLSSVDSRSQFIIGSMDWFDTVIPSWNQGDAFNKNYPGTLKTWKPLEITVFLTV